MGFGSSKQKSQQQSQSTSTSSNQAFPFLQSSLGSTVNNVSKGSDALAALLGIGGNPAAQTAAFNTFRDSSGYDFVRDEGLRAIEGNMSARGMLNSGSALKAAGKYSSNLANNFLNSYLQSLMGYTNTGLQAGSIIGGAGQTSSSQSTSSGNSSGKSTNFTLG